MGEARANEQVRAYRLARGLCVCNRRTIKNHGTFRTIHEPSCSKFKPWMQEYLDMPRRGWGSSDE